MGTRCWIWTLLVPRLTTNTDSKWASDSRTGDAVAGLLHALDGCMAVSQALRHAGHCGGHAGPAGCGQWRSKLAYGAGWLPASSAKQIRTLMASGSAIQAIPEGCMTALEQLDVTGCRQLYPGWLPADVSVHVQIIR